MMTTANDLINAAYVRIGFKDPSDALSGQDAAYALDALNDMIDHWNTQKLMIVTVQEVATNISGQTVTIGPSATINVDRPVKMEDGAFTRSGGVDYPLKWIQREEYNALPLKNVFSTFPEYGYYDAALPTGTIYLYPYSTATIALHLQLQVQLSEFADLTTSYDLAPGYRRAIYLSLCEELADGLRPLDPSIVRRASLARKAIKRTNARVPILSPAGNRNATNIFAG